MEKNPKTLNDENYTPAKVNEGANGGKTGRQPRIEHGCQSRDYQRQTQHRLYRTESCQPL